MIKLVVNKEGRQKRLFFESREDGKKLNPLLEKQVSDDLDFRDTITEVLRVAHAEGFSVISH